MRPIVTIRRHSPPPLEVNDPGRPRPFALQCLAQCLEVWKRNPRAIVRFSYPAERRPLRELEQRQARVETQIRLDNGLASLAEHLARQRETDRIAARRSELHDRLRAKVT